MKFFLICFLLILLLTTKGNSQNVFDADELAIPYFVSLNIGAQMSGIKDEDFISSNYSPLFNIKFGKWISSCFALQVGYKGFYFYSISDEIKHRYDFFYGEVSININELINSKRTSKCWGLLFHSGTGYFYNPTYSKSSICANVGIQNNFKLSDHLQLNFDVASIIGWKIYQGDEDILPGIMIGVDYFINVD